MTPVRSGASLSVMVVVPELVAERISPWAETLGLWVLPVATGVQLTITYLAARPFLEPFAWRGFGKGEFLHVIWRPFCSFVRGGFGFIIGASLIFAIWRAVVTFGCAGYASSLADGVEKGELPGWIWLLRTFETTTANLSLLPHPVCILSLVRVGIQVIADPSNLGQALGGRFSAMAAQGATSPVDFAVGLALFAWAATEVSVHLRGCQRTPDDVAVTIRRILRFTLMWALVSGLYLDIFDFAQTFMGKPSLVTLCGTTMGRYYVLVVANAIFMPALCLLVNEKLPLRLAVSAGFALWRRSFRKLATIVIPMTLVRTAIVALIVSPFVALAVSERGHLTAGLPFVVLGSFFAMVVMSGLQICDYALMSIVVAYLREKKLPGLEGPPQLTDDSIQIHLYSRLDASGERSGSLASKQKPLSSAGGEEDEQTGDSEQLGNN